MDDSIESFFHPHLNIHPKTLSAFIIKDSDITHGKYLALLLSPPQRPLCIVGRLLCCGEAGEKEKESARGSHRPPRAFYFCRLLIF